MILEIDMGNTRLKWRIRDPQKTLAQGCTGTEDSLDLLALGIEPYRNAISAMLVASVIGEGLEVRLAEWSASYLGLQPKFVRATAICGQVRNGYSQPESLGVDRWLGIIAAYRRTGKACVVVSCGTAVTLDLIANDGQHLGGFIAPGLMLMLDSLTSKTRLVKLDNSLLELSLSAATTTSEAVYSACAAMLKGLIDNGLGQLHQLHKDIEPELIFTGGDAIKLLPFYPQARMAPNLVLDGLACVLDYPSWLEQ